MSTEGTPPPGSPPPIPVGPIPMAPVFQLVEVGRRGRGPWSLTILPTHLALADGPGAQPYVILREQMMKSVIFMEGLRSLVLKEPQKISLKMTSEAAKSLAEWIGRPFLVSFYLNRRYRMVWPWALIWILGSLLPWPRSGRGPEVIVDPVALILGLVLFGLWGFARWRPHPVLFLVDTVWFLCAAAMLASHVLQYHWSKAWFVIVAFLILGAVTGVMHFVRFRKTVIPARGSQA